MAVTLKRWHDRNKSSSWLVLMFVPIVGPIWTLFECGFLKGSPGENRFGSDPLAPDVELIFA